MLKVLQLPQYYHPEYWYSSTLESRVGWRLGSSTSTVIIKSIQNDRKSRGLFTIFKKSSQKCFGHRLGYVTKYCHSMSFFVIQRGRPMYIFQCLIPNVKSDCYIPLTLNPNPKSSFMCAMAGRYPLALYSPLLQGWLFQHQHTKQFFQK